MAARAQAAAAVVQEQKPRAHNLIPYADVLTALDKRVDRLNRERDFRKRLVAGVGLIAELFAFSEELTARLWAVRGALALKERPE